MSTPILASLIALESEGITFDPVTNTGSTCMNDGALIDWLSNTGWTTEECTDHEDDGAVYVHSGAGLVLWLKEENMQFSVHSDAMLPDILRQYHAACEIRENDRQADKGDLLADMEDGA
jgi:hypothetical protein